MSITKELYDWLLIDVDGPSVSTNYDSAKDIVKYMLMVVITQLK